MGATSMVGRRARNKQSDPAPLPGSRPEGKTGKPARSKKRKAPAAAEAGSTTLKPKKARHDPSGGRSRPSSKGKAKASAAKSSSKGRSAPAEGSDDDDDFDLDDLEAEDSYGEASDDEDSKLQATRASMFNAADLQAPVDGMDDEDSDRADDDDDDDLAADEFDLDDLEANQSVLDDELVDGDQIDEEAVKAAAEAYDSDDAAAAAAEDDEDEALEHSADEEVDSDDDEEGDEDEQLGGALTDLRAVERRLRKSVRMLTHWKELGAQSGRARSEVVAQVIGDVCQYYGYNVYLAEKLFHLFSPEEALAFFNASDMPRPVTLRVNTLRTRRRDLAQALINRGVNLEPLEGGWSKVGLQVFSGSSVPVGATPESLAGHYILQAASSFLPCVALDPQPHERVLDMSAAPGGKATYMSALMGNTGEVWANDASRQRIKGLGGNIARLGCKNVIVTNLDGRDFPKVIGGFDRVLLDSPCSGTGVISKDQSVKVNKSERDFMLLSHLQKRLVLCAIDSVTPNSKSGGYVVYSTCSVTTEENEAVVAYALRKRPHAKLVDTGLTFGREGFRKYRGKDFGPTLNLTRRFFPHVHNMDGFFVAKFKVGKPAKAQPMEDEEPVVDAPANLLEGLEDVGVSADAEQEPVAFDDSEDAELIEQSKRRHMRKKGYRVPPKQVKS